jgi:hypothetical protein
MIPVSMVSQRIESSVRRFSAKQGPFRQEIPDAYALCERDSMISDPALIGVIGAAIYRTGAGPMTMSYIFFVPAQRRIRGNPLLDRNLIVSRNGQAL